MPAPESWCEGGLTPSAVTPVGGWPVCLAAPDGSTNAERRQVCVRGIPLPSRCAWRLVCTTVCGQLGAGKVDMKVHCPAVRLFPAGFFEVFHPPPDAVIKCKFLVKVSEAGVVGTRLCRSTGTRGAVLCERLVVFFCA